MTPVSPLSAKIFAFLLTPLLAPLIASGAFAVQSRAAAPHTRALLHVSAPRAAQLPPDLPPPPALVSDTFPSSPQAGEQFAGLPQFGELVWQNPDGTPGARLCSAVAVDSAGGDLIATAAHCLGGVVSRVGGPMVVAYIPGAAGSSRPYGVWYPTRILRPQQWMNGVKNPDYDIAFLTVDRPGNPAPLESITGAEHFGGVPAAGALAVQIGYPDDSTQPLACRTAVRFPSPSQLQLDCVGFAAGSSGGPVLTNVNPANGIGTVVGVVGGYENGGLSPNISYAAALNPNIQALYKAASQY